MSYVVVSNSKKGDAAAMGLFPPILDACCGGRTFWEDKDNEKALYIDFKPRPKGTCPERPEWNCSPDITADFTRLDWIPDNTFYHIIFDPPHLVDMQENTIMARKYGSLQAETWQQTLKDGFKELWRVLRPGGTLIFKWNEYHISHAKVLRLFAVKPLYGHPTAKSGKTKWWAFYKELEEGDV